MSTQATIVKKPSGHNLEVTVLNGTTVTKHTLIDNQACEVLTYGDGIVILREVPKPVAVAIGTTSHGEPIGGHIPRD